MRKVVRVYQEWISMEDRPVFMKEPEEGPYPIATGDSLDSGSQLGDKEEEVRMLVIVTHLIDSNQSKVHITQHLQIYQHALFFFLVPTGVLTGIFSVSFTVKGEGDKFRSATQSF